MSIWRDELALEIWVVRPHSIELLQSERRPSDCPLKPWSEDAAGTAFAEEMGAFATEAMEVTGK